MLGTKRTLRFSMANFLVQAQTIETGLRTSQKQEIVEVPTHDYYTTTSPTWKHRDTSSSLII